jgi:hypothetical protein
MECACCLNIFRYNKGARVSAFHFIFQPDKAETGKICLVRFHVHVTETSTGQREKNILSLKLAF